jgi:hypothetical protein
VSRPQPDRRGPRSMVIMNLMQSLNENFRADNDKNRNGISEHFRRGEENRA